MDYLKLDSLPANIEYTSNDYIIGKEAIKYKIPVITTLSGAHAAVRSIRSLQSNKLSYYSLQEIFN